MTQQHQFYNDLNRFNHYDNMHRIYAISPDLSLLAVADSGCNKIDLYDHSENDLNHNDRSYPISTVELTHNINHMIIHPKQYFIIVATDNGIIFYDIEFKTEIMTLFRKDKGTNNCIYIHKYSEFDNTVSALYADGVAVNHSESKWDEGLLNLV